MKKPLWGREFHRVAASLGRPWHPPLKKKGAKFWGESFYFFIFLGGWGGSGVAASKLFRAADMESPTKEIEEFESTALKYLQPEQIEKIWLRLRGL